MLMLLPWTKVITLKSYFEFYIALLFFNMGKYSDSFEEVFKNRWIKLTAFIAIILILCCFIYLLRDIVLAFMLTFVIAYLLEPAVTWFSKITLLNRSVSVLIITMVSLIIIFGVGMLIYLDFKTFSSLPEHQKKQQTIISNIGDANSIKQTIEKQGTKLPEQFQPIARQVLEKIGAKLQEEFRNFITYLGSMIVSISKSIPYVVSGIFMFVIYLIVMVYLMRDMNLILNSAEQCIPEKYRAGIVRICRIYSVDLRGYFRGQLIVIGTQFVIFLAGFYFFGISYAIPIAFFTASLNIIPYLGTLTGSAFGFMVCMMTYGIDVHILLVVAVILIGQLMDFMFITPLLIGKHARLNPVAVIMSLIIFWELLGIYGVLLAIPISVGLKILFREAIRKINVQSDIEK
jgi:predicted PurR-regulated permease PerM